MTCLFAQTFSLFFVLFCNDLRIAFEMHFCNHRGPVTALLWGILNCMDYQTTFNGKPKVMISQENNSQCGLVQRSAMFRKNVTRIISQNLFENTCDGVPF